MSFQTAVNIFKNLIISLFVIYCVRFLHSTGGYLMINVISLLLKNRKRKLEKALTKDENMEMCP